MKLLRASIAALLFGAGTLGAHAAQQAPAPGFALFDTQVHFYSNDFTKFPLHDEHAYMGQAVMTRRAAEHPTLPRRVFADWKAEGVGAGVGIQYGAAYGGDNRFLLSVASRFPARVKPLVILDPEAPGAAATLVRLAREHGVAGFRKLGHRAPEGGYPWLRTPGMLALWKAADEHGLVVELMPYPREPDPRFLRDVGELAARYPHARIVLDHLAWAMAGPAPDFGMGAAFQALAPARNVYWKFTTENLEHADFQPRAMQDLVQRAVQLFGADHVMWGSDMGNTMLPYHRMVQAALVATQGLDATQRRAVLSTTGKSVYGVSKP